MVSQELLGLRGSPAPWVLRGLWVQRAARGLKVKLDSWEKEDRPGHEVKLEPLGQPVPEERRAQMDPLVPMEPQAPQETRVR